MEETVILALLLCLMLYAIGWVSKIWPVAFVGSLGWIIVGLRIYDDGQDILVLALMLCASLAMVVCVRDHSEAA